MPHTTGTVLRIAAGLAILALGVLSAVLVLSAPGQPWFSACTVIVCVITACAGSLVLSGRSRGGRLEPSRRWWRYAAAVAFAALTAGSLAAVAGGLSNASSLAAFPALTGLALSQLFEPEGSRNSSPVRLSSSRIGTWKRIRSGLVIAAVLFGVQSILSAVLNAAYIAAVTAPLSLLCLIAAAAVEAMLRAQRNPTDSRV